MLEPTNDFPFAGYRDVLATIVAHAQPAPSLRVLDVGTGTGNLAASFTAAGCRVVGIDFSAAMLQHARINVPHAHFVQMDILDAWPASIQPSFDRIVSAYVWHEFDLATKLRLLQRCAAYVASGGQISIGDIAFATAAQRTHARQSTAAWDEDEFYWAADEAQSAAATLGIPLVYHPVSWCGGVFTWSIG